MNLLPTQKASVHSAIVRDGFDPREFSWRRHSDPSVGSEYPEIVHRPSGFFLRFQQRGGVHECIFSPGLQHEINYSNGGSWDFVLSMVRTWLRYLKREISVIDPWSAIEELSSQHIAGTFSNDNELFTPREIRVIHSQLDSLASEVERLGIGSSMEREAICGSISELKEASGRIGKKDWRLLLVGAMTSLVIEKVVSPNTMRSVWGLIDGVFHGIVRLIAAG